MRDITQINSKRERERERDKRRSTPLHLKIYSTQLNRKIGAKNARIKKNVDTDFFLRLFLFPPQIPPCMLRMCAFNGRVIHTVYFMIKEFSE